ncbi:MAG TPA: RHS repeat-associated core domain-containing protein, partial [Arenibacter sp.]|nr:RHS repeat-associated core domain-containing protein [Arenibacter sp.]
MNTAIISITNYAYDGNGNMVKDLNKGIGSSATNGIAYNFLNLPTEVKFNNSNTKKINYIYDATGNKLEKKVTEGSSIIRTYYAGSYVYEYVSGHVENLKFFSHPEGYAEVRNRGADPGGDPWNPPVPDFDYVFQYKDHLGNIRLTYKENSNGINGIGSTSEVFFEDFESASGWDSEGAKYGTSLVYNGEHTRSGDYAGVLSRTNDADIYSHSNTWIDIDNSVPTRYDFSGWVYAEDVSGNTSRCKIMLFMNEEGETEYYTLVAESTSTFVVGQWVYLKGSYIVPPNIKKINLRVDMHSGGGAGTAWFDDLSIHRVNAAEIVAENHYYPFGLEHKGYNKDNIGSTNIALKRKFGGKEYQDELSLGWYDITARNYDPALGRWMNVDPLAEVQPNKTPYHFVSNNPINRIDPTGMLDNPIYDTDGNFLGTDDRGLQGDAIVMNKGNFSQGMAHSEAKAYDLSPNLGFMDESAKSKMNTHFGGLEDRPHYDGFGTMAEGIKWVKEHPNKLPDNI